MNDNFCPSHTVVEPDTWERGPVFRHFIDDLRCVMSLTVDLEISRFLKRLSASGFRFYPAMIWAVSNVLNAHAEFRYGWDDQGRLVLWDRIEPYYAHFHPDRETFAKLVTPFSDVSCLPWVRYRSFDMHIFDSGTYLAPVVTWGKYEREGDRTVLPVSLNIHHAVADGFHLSRFFLELQELLDAPEIS